MSDAAPVYPLALRLLELRRDRPRPSQQHVFKPRKHGTPKACEICGGDRWDEIHIDPWRRD